MDEEQVQNPLFTERKTNSQKRKPRKIRKNSQINSKGNKKGERDMVAGKLLRNLKRSITTLTYVQK